MYSFLVHRILDNSTLNTILVIHSIAHENQQKSNINLTSNSQNPKKKHLIYRNLRILITDMILALSNKRKQPSKLKQLTLV